MSEHCCLCQHTLGHLSGKYCWNGVSAGWMKREPSAEIGTKNHGFSLVIEEIVDRENRGINTDNQRGNSDP